MQVHVSITAEPLFRIDLPFVGSLAITNTIVTMWLVMAVLAGLAYASTRNMQLVPSGLQNLAESAIESLFGLVSAATGRYARTIFPLIATLFIFITTANWFGLLPGFGTILIRAPEERPAAAGHAQMALVSTQPDHDATPLAVQGAEKEAKGEGGVEFVPLLRAANSDLNTTLAMGLIAFLAIHISGIRVHGFVGYLKHLATPIFLTPINVVIDMFVPVSLSFRLFGNIFGGETLLTVMSLPVVAVVFMLLETLFGFIQAIIFSMLTLIFTSLMVADMSGHSRGGESGLGTEPTQRAH